MSNDVLSCPLCRAKSSGSIQPEIGLQDQLQRVGNSYQCAQGHSFDLAKQGYLNLLLPQHKRSKDPGDSKSMVQARRAFLEQGFYQPVATQLAALLRHHLPSGANRVLDAGCGEGYYIRQAAQHVSGLQWYGNDISKWAVQAAAAKHKEGTYLVASNARLPIASGSMAAVVCAFGFAAEDEFKRVLASDGVLLMVDPGPQHLVELRQVLYGENLHAKTDHKAERQGWHCAGEQSCTYTQLLPTAEAIQALVAMTPHQHRASRAGLQKLTELNELEVTVDVSFRTYQPNGDIS